MGKSRDIPVYKYMELTECCGCENCVNICPVHIIHMEEDNLGFRYPQFDSQKCIQCSQCVSVCPQLKKVSQTSVKNTIVGYSKNKNIVSNSSSGGFFRIISEQLLKSNDINQQEKWIIVGAEWNEDFTIVHHSIADNVSSLDSLMRSKYIQSRKNDIVDRIKEALISGKKVLFCGCPCEVAALYSYIPQKFQEKLYTIDVVCQGPTSEKAWIQYKKYLEKKNKSVISYVNMRLAKGEWIPQYLHIRFESGKEFKQRLYETPFGDAVRIMQRESCYSCHYPTVCSKADITFGDYHGISRECKVYNQEGVSLAVSHTKKGDYLLSLINSQNSVFEREEFYYLAEKNPRMLKPWNHRKGYDIFIEEFVLKGLIIASKKAIGSKEYIRRHLPAYVLKVYFLFKKLAVKE